jgi:hypothetical protein
MLPGSPYYFKPEENRNEHMSNHNEGLFWCDYCRIYVTPIKKPTLVGEKFNPLLYLVSREVGLGQDYTAYYLWKKDSRFLEDYVCPKCGKSELVVKEKETFKPQLKFDPDTKAGKNYWGGFDLALANSSLSVEEIRVVINKLKVNEKITIISIDEKIYHNKIFFNGFIDGLNELVKMKEELEYKNIVNKNRFKLKL